MLEKYYVMKINYFFKFFIKTLIIFGFFNTYLFSQSLDGFDSIELDIDQVDRFQTLNSNGIPLSISGFTGIVQVKVSSNDGVIRLPITTGLSIPTNSTYSSSDWSSGSNELAFEGSSTNINSALEQLEFKSTTGSNGIINFIVLPQGSPSCAGSSFLEFNGHYYRYSNCADSWLNHKSFSESETFAGCTGYLATITSQEEQDFLVNKFDNRSAATTGWGYLGGSDADSGTGYSSSTVTSEGTWKWVVGPENGTTFYCDGGADPSCDAGSNFSKYDGSEPNNCCSGEHHLQINFGGIGRWNDHSVDMGGFYEFCGDLNQDGDTTDPGEFPTGIVNENITVDFADISSKPILVSTFPNDNQIDVPNTIGSIVLNFNMNITINNGAASLYLSDGSLIEKFENSLSNIRGDGTKTIRLILQNKLELNSSYYITISQTMFSDGNENYYSGISNQTSFNFSTVDEIPNPLSDKETFSTLESMITSSQKVINKSVNYIDDRLTWKKRDKRGNDVFDKLINLKFSNMTSSEQRIFENLILKDLNYDLFPSNNFWIGGDFEIGHVSESFLSSMSSSRIKNFIFGVDKEIEDYIFGLSILFTKEKNKFGYQGSKSRMSGNSINFYFENKKSNFSYQIGVSDLNFYNTRIFGGDNYSSKRNAYQIFQSFKKDTYFERDLLYFNSFINLVFGHTNFRPFTEDGSYGALHIKEQKINYLRGSLGIKVDKPYFTSKGLLRPNVKLQINRENTRGDSFAAAYLFDLDNIYSRELELRNSTNLESTIGLDFNYYDAWISTYISSNRYLESYTDNKRSINSKAIGLKASYSF